MNFNEYKIRLLEHLQKSIRLFSNKGKKELELRVVKKYLNSIDLSYEYDELIQPPQHEEPPDIIFRDACFEVMELYDESRQRHRELKERLKRIIKAKNYSDVDEPETWDIEAVSLQELLARAENRLQSKKGHYSENTMANLDVLIYVNLPKITIDDEDLVFTLDMDSKLTQWRSVSLVFNNNLVCIAYASTSAPDFIQNIAGDIIKS